MTKTTVSNENDGGPNVPTENCGVVVLGQLFRRWVVCFYIRANEKKFWLISDGTLMPFFIKKSQKETKCKLKT